MKKLLSLLSVLTISGTAVPTVIAASPYQKEKLNNNINYQKINISENLIRNKRSVVYSFENKDDLNIKERNEELCMAWSSLIRNGEKLNEKCIDKITNKVIVLPHLKWHIKNNNLGLINKNTDETILSRLSILNPNLNISKFKIVEKNNNYAVFELKNMPIKVTRKIFYLINENKENNIINLHELINKSIFLFFKNKNQNIFINEIDLSYLNYSDIELIKEEELSMQKTTEDICMGETEFENSLSTEQKFKAQSCKYTKQKINSIQIIKGINKRIDNTLESGESSTGTTSTTNNNTKTTSINVGAEVSAGWGPFSASVSTSVGSEESNTSQIENSESKTKNISKIISNSASFDLSNLKEEQEIITNELEYPSQEITVGGNQSIKVIFNLNKIIKKYKVTFKQNIDGKIKSKIKNENDEIIEQEFSIKDIMLNLKEKNLLPKEIIIDNNLVSFIGQLIVSKNSSKLKVKTEEKDAI